MKMSPEYQKAQKNMEPGVITAYGFLGDDHRPIIEIITEDEERMAKAGLEFEATGERLRELLMAGRKGMGEPVTVEGKWLVKTDETRGYLASPFEDGIFRKMNTVVEPVGPEHKGLRLMYSELSLHLLEKWHFLQGKGSTFRLEPDTIRKVLGV